MVDAERLHRILRRATDDLAVLRTYPGGSAEDLLADVVRLGHVKYLFITMLEAWMTGGSSPTSLISTTSASSPAASSA